MSSIARKKRRPNGSNSRNKDLQHQKLIKTVDSFLKSIASVDLRLTKKCSICADKDSSVGNLRPLMKALEISCHGIPWLLGTVALLLTLHKAAHIEVLINLLIGLLGDLIVVAFLKFLFQRPRPAHNKMDMFATLSVDNYSFPSGHATRAAMVAFLLTERLVVNSSFPGLILLWSVFVAASRLMLGRHHVSDVLFGYLIGYIQYKVLSSYWLSEQTCMYLVEPIFRNIHH
ncbi:phospholipid phosphatase 6-like [Mizuhopecten yessoensis]|uniref:Presqualene diphosphate phosphatase n=1 Tax=Mizuhopecten yessoensis TaxID=6573 RepID=A0A210QQB4_MIZYE|nr:phospholipid phosphatase 6-like [Mizuhopecten yessoensis]OWF50920.1 Presqualene diphosphate phosphatase [Mizuhopecten yessoensis]